MKYVTKEDWLRIILIANKRKIKKAIRELKQLTKTLEEILEIIEGMEK